VQIGVNTLMVQLSADTRMSVLLLGSSHIHRLKHYVNKLQQQEFNLDDNIIIKLFGINGGVTCTVCNRYRSQIFQISLVSNTVSINDINRVSVSLIAKNYKLLFSINDYREL
jgi:hypothetical protein